MAITRYTQPILTENAIAACNPAQKATLEKALTMGWRVNKILTSHGVGSVVWVDTPATSGCVLLDGSLARPIKGKKSVFVNSTTLQRVWK